MNQSAKFQQRNFQTRVAELFRATLAALAVVATWGAPTLASAQVSAPTGATSQLKPVAGQLVSFDIRKTTGAVQIPGSYLFSVTCTGLGGPYTGPNPVAVVLPSPGVSSVNVPAGALCIVKETPPAGSWNDPVFSGSGVAVMMGGGWEAKVGPVTAKGGVLTVENQRKVGPITNIGVGVAVNAAIGLNPTLTVRKILFLANDPGKFNLRIDGVIQAFAAGNNGTTGAITTSVGTHSVSEVAADDGSTDLANYITTFGGDCSATGSVTLAAGDNKTCTITNRRRVVEQLLSNSAVKQPTIASLDPAVLQAMTQLKVVKQLVPATDPGRFILIIDGQIPGGLFGGAANVGHNGTTGFVTVAAGSHIVSESGSLGTDSNNYTASFSANCPGGYVTLQLGASETCTITNMRKHGELTYGPGTAGGPGIYIVTVCATGPSCTIYGTPGQLIPITFEVWGAGGGGGGGNSNTYVLGDSTDGYMHGGSGGGGGGGGGYGKATITATVPMSGAVAFYVHVGAGGTAGVINGSWPYYSANGDSGGISEVSFGTGGTIVLVTGGVGGGAVPVTGGTGGSGTSSSGAATTSVGLPGGNGAIVTGCNGGAGGAGGVGGGPGAINNGGHGGNGGYYNAGTGLYGGCTAQSENNGRTNGDVGKNGLVKIVW